MDVHWSKDLDRWLDLFTAALGHKTRARMCPAYVAGLIGPGDRKNVQPMAARDTGVSYDQLHHFIGGGSWDVAPLEAALRIEADKMVGGNAAWLIVDDTALPKKGRHSVGAAPQYASTLGQERELPDDGVSAAGVEWSACHGGFATPSARQLGRRRRSSRAPTFPASFVATEPSGR